MSFLTVLSLVALGVACAQACNDPGIVPDDCMNCICQVESRCDASIGCKMDVGSLSCGPFQIKLAYYTDAAKYSSSIGPDWKTCTSGSDALCCSERTVQAYITHYATYQRLGHQPTCEDMSRIHNGGPNGFKNPSTLGYWDKVKQCLGVQMLQKFNITKEVY